MTIGLFTTYTNLYGKLNKKHNTQYYAILLL